MSRILISNAVIPNADLNNSSLKKINDGVIKNKNIDNANKNDDIENISSDYDEDYNEDYDETNSSDSKNTILSAKDIVFTSKEILHYKTVDKFFKKTSRDNIQKMLNIINGKSKISLRLLDWLVTRYAYNHKIIYDIDGTEDPINIHISYKAQLRSYKKKYFDPFRRREKKFYYYYYDNNNNKKKFFTTIGQLNFFRWAFTNHIVKYVEENYKTLLQAMNVSNKEDKKRKLARKDKKNETDTTVSTVTKKGVKVSAKKTIKNDEVKITISFD